MIKLKIERSLTTKISIELNVLSAQAKKIEEFGFDVTKESIMDEVIENLQQLIFDKLDGFYSDNKLAPNTAETLDYSIDVTFNK